MLGRCQGQVALAIYALAALACLAAAQSDPRVVAITYPAEVALAPGPAFSQGVLFYTLRFDPVLVGTSFSPPYSLNLDAVFSNAFSRNIDDTALEDPQRPGWFPYPDERGFKARIQAIAADGTTNTYVFDVHNSNVYLDGVTFTGLAPQPKAATLKGDQTPGDPYQGQDYTVITTFSNLNTNFFLTADASFDGVADLEVVIDNGGGGVPVEVSGMAGIFRSGDVGTFGPITMSDNGFLTVFVDVVASRNPLPMPSGTPVTNARHVIEFYPTDTTLSTLTMVIDPDGEGTGPTTYDFGFDPSVYEYNIVLSADDIILDGVTGDPTTIEFTYAANHPAAEANVRDLNDIFMLTFTAADDNDATDGEHGPFTFRTEDEGGAEGLDITRNSEGYSLAFYARQFLTPVGIADDGFTPYVVNIKYSTFSTTVKVEIDGESSGGPQACEQDWATATAFTEALDTVAGDTIFFWFTDPSASTGFAGCPTTPETVTVTVVDWTHGATHAFFIQTMDLDADAQYAVVEMPVTALDGVTVLTTTIVVLASPAGVHNFWSDLARLRTLPNLNVGEPDEIGDLMDVIQRTVGEFSTVELGEIFTTLFQHLTERGLVVPESALTRFDVAAEDFAPDMTDAFWDDICSNLVLSAPLLSGRSKGYEEFADVFARYAEAVAYDKVARIELFTTEGPSEICREAMQVILNDAVGASAVDGVTPTIIWADSFGGEAIDETFSVSVEFQGAFGTPPGPILASEVLFRAGNPQGVDFSSAPVTFDGVDNLGTLLSISVLNPSTSSEGLVSPVSAYHTVQVWDADNLVKLPLTNTNLDVCISSKFVLPTLNDPVGQGIISIKSLATGTDIWTDEGISNVFCSSDFLGSTNECCFTTDHLSTFVIDSNGCAFDNCDACVSASACGWCRRVELGPSTKDEGCVPGTQEGPGGAPGGCGLGSWDYQVCECDDQRLLDLNAPTTSTAQAALASYESVIDDPSGLATLTVRAEYLRQRTAWIIDFGSHLVPGLRSTADISAANNCENRSPASFLSVDLAGWWDAWPVPADQFLADPTTHPTYPVSPYWAPFELNEDGDGDACTFVAEMGVAFVGTFSLIDFMGCAGSDGTLLVDVAFGADGYAVSGTVHAVLAHEANSPAFITSNAHEWDFAMTGWKCWHPADGQAGVVSNGGRSCACWGGYAPSTSGAAVCDVKTGAVACLELLTVIHGVGSSAALQPEVTLEILDGSTGATDATIRVVVDMVMASDKFVSSIELGSRSAAEAACRYPHLDSRWVKVLDGDVCLDRFYIELSLLEAEACGMIPEITNVDPTSVITATKRRRRGIEDISQWVVYTADVAVTTTTSLESGYESLDVSVARKVIPLPVLFSVGLFATGSNGTLQVTRTFDFEAALTAVGWDVTVDPRQALLTVTTVSSHPYMVADLDLVSFPVGVTVSDPVPTVGSTAVCADVRNSFCYQEWTVRLAPDLPCGVSGTYVWEASFACLDDSPGACDLDGTSALVTVADLDGDALCSIVLVDGASVLAADGGTFTDAARTIASTDFQMGTTVFGKVVITSPAFEITLVTIVGVAVWDVTPGAAVASAPAYIGFVDDGTSGPAAERLFSFYLAAADFPVPVGSIGTFALSVELSVAYDDGSRRRASAVTPELAPVIRINAYTEGYSVSDTDGPGGNGLAGGNGDGGAAGTGVGAWLTENPAALIGLVAGVGLVALVVVIAVLRSRTKRLSEEEYDDDDDNAKHGGRRRRRGRGSAVPLEKRISFGSSTSSGGSGSNKSSDETDYYYYYNNDDGGVGGGDGGNRSRGPATGSGFSLGYASGGSSVYGNSATRGRVEGAAGYSHGPSSSTLFDLESVDDGDRHGESTGESVAVDGAYDYGAYSRGESEFGTYAKYSSTVALYSASQSGE